MYLYKPRCLFRISVLSLIVIVLVLIILLPLSYLHLLESVPKAMFN